MCVPFHKKTPSVGIYKNLIPCKCKGNDYTLTSLCVLYTHHRLQDFFTSNSLFLTSRGEIEIRRIMQTCQTYKTEWHWCSHLLLTYIKTQLLHGFFLHSQVFRIPLWIKLSFNCAPYTREDQREEVFWSTNHGDDMFWWVLCSDTIHFLRTQSIPNW